MSTRPFILWQFIWVINCFLINSWALTQESWLLANKNVSAFIILYGNFRNTFSSWFISINGNLFIYISMHDKCKLGNMNELMTVKSILMIKPQIHVATNGTFIIRYNKFCIKRMVPLINPNIFVLILLLSIKFVFGS